jgi:hypothetical protein
MSQEIYCVARTDEQARGVVEEIKTLGIDPDKLKVIAKPDQIGFSTCESEELRNASKGAITGTIIGLLFGAAVLGTMGIAGISGVFEAILLLACAAFGGAMFGAIVGSTGLFARKRISTPLEYHLAEEVGSGHILISVRAKNANERERLIRAIEGLGMTDVYYSTEQAA